MNIRWNRLISTEQLEHLFTNSENKPQLIFKHSTRCIISKIVFNKVDADVDRIDQKADLWFLDLLNFREISNQIAEKTGIIHQSPQVVVISKNATIYAESHENIDITKIPF